jgi:hypothetical protein
MARTLDDPNQYLAAYAWYRDGVTSAPAMAKLLADSFGDRAKAPRTIADWFPKFDRAIELTSDVDAIFRWHKLDEHGLGWVDGGVLLRYWSVSQRQIIAAYSQLGIRMPGPSVRRVRWWGRVSRAAPDLPDIDVMAIAAAYERRELRRDLLAEPFDCDDLDAFLGLRPWDDKSDYEESIRLRLVKPIRPDSSKKVLELADQMTTIVTTVSPKLANSDPQVVESLVEHSRWKSSQGMKLSLGGFEWPDEDHDPPWLLPSARYGRASQATGESHE